MVRILSQGVCISDYHIVHFKFLTIVFVNYISIKLKKKIMVISQKAGQKKKKRKIRDKRRKLKNQFRRFHIPIIEVTERENRQKRTGK